MRKHILIILLIVGLAGAGYVAYQRIRVESLNKAVELVIDYDECAQMAASSGTAVSGVLESFNRNGAKSVAISDMTIQDAIDGGLIVSVSSRQIMVRNDIVRSAVAHLRIIFPNPASVAMGDYSGGSFTLVTIPDGVPPAYLAQLPIGLPHTEVMNAQEAGMNVVARLSSFPGASPRAIEGIVQTVKDIGVKTIIFQGDQILGFKGAEDDTADMLVSNNINFGRVEFSKQKGEMKVARKCAANTITVHSIPQAEMAGMDEASAIERFGRGVRERGVRMCYVRMFYSGGEDTVRENGQYIANIAHAIVRAGYSLQDAHPLEEVKVPIVARVACGLGVGAGAGLLLIAIFDLSVAELVVWMGVISLSCMGLSAGPEVGRKITALLCALIFPTLAVISLAKPNNNPDEQSRIFLTALVRILVAVLITVAGGLLIVGLISERSFMMRVYTFMGVKMAHLIPVVLLAIAFVGGLVWEADSWKRQKEKLVESVKNFASNPVLVWQAVVTLAVLAIVGLMVARSGNDSGLEVSSLELKFRSILDKILYVRPRSKEFLIGYPALLLGTICILKGKRSWAAPLLVLGSIGLISALNSFCHIHTPLILSLIRVANGVWVGALVGGIVYLIVRKTWQSK